MEKKYFIIDFDSTFIKYEALEVLAEIVLKNNSLRKKILEKIKGITKKGMEGKIGFHEELFSRLELLSINQDNIPDWIDYLKKHVSISLLKNKSFLKKNAPQIYIISGAFKECIVPIAHEYGIMKNHIFANTFVFDKKGNCIGVDTKNPLAYDKGKVKIAQSLNLKGKIFILGDGHTDFLIKQTLGDSVRFVAFTENIKRDVVVKKADYIVNNFDEFIEYVNNNESTAS